MSQATARGPGGAASHRDPWLDNVKVLAITLVVVGHGIGLIRNQTALTPALSNFIYLFHIPLFAAMSGWTIQRLVASGEGLKRICLQLLVPYLIFETISAAMYAVWTDEDFRPTYATASFGLWYLLSLATWRIWWPWLSGLDRRKTWIAAVVAAVGVGYMTGITDALSLSRTFVFFPAFLVGALFGPDLQPVLKRRRVRALSVVVLIAGFLFAWVTRDSLDRAWILGRDPYAPSSSFVSAAAWRTAAIVGGVILALAAASVVTSRHGRLTHLGAFTLYAYLLHIVIRQIVVQRDLIPDDAGYVGLVAMIVGCATLTVALMTAPVRAVTWPLVDPARYGRGRK